MRQVWISEFHLGWLVRNFLFIACAALGPSCSCNSGGLPVDLGDDIPVVISSGDLGCVAVGGFCMTSEACCSGSCDSTGHCAAGACRGNGAVCKFATDCCNLNCSSGSCSGLQCISDNQSCTIGGDACCSGQCVGGTCQPLNSTCKTAGNSCPGGNSDCCSRSCQGGFCAAPAQISYCTQAGDICYRDNDCCTGVCSGVTSTRAGTCATVSTGCAVDGTVCTGCTGCCSSYCAPYGADGPRICQPASGCRVLGDVCHATIDCCGGDVASGLPGAGLVRCVPDPIHPQVGTCSQANPNNCPGGQETCKNTCQPEGDVCHYLGNGGCSSNSFPANCCGAPGSGKGVCKIDAVGVPRCYGLTDCVSAGGNCASSTDCCNGIPCLPDSQGRLKCSAANCQPEGSVCTTTTDCCTGFLCAVPPGFLGGVCVNPNAPAPSDMGIDLGAPVCALYGQRCSTTVACCNGITCRHPIDNNSPPCTDPGFTDCTCYDDVIQ